MTNEPCKPGCAVIHAPQPLHNDWLETMDKLLLTTHAEVDIPRWGKCLAILDILDFSNEVGKLVNQAKQEAYDRGYRDGVDSVHMSDACKQAARAAKREAYDEATDIIRGIEYPDDSSDNVTISFWCGASEASSKIIKMLEAKRDSL